MAARPFSFSVWLWNPKRGKRRWGMGVPQGGGIGGGKGRGLQGTPTESGSLVLPWAEQACSCDETGMIELQCAGFVA